MPRIYYTDRKLYDPPSGDDFINPEVVSYILENIMDLNDPRGFQLSENNVFSQTWLHQDKYTNDFYTDNEGHKVFLPNGLIFADVVERNQPIADWCFLVFIDGSIELRTVKFVVDIKFYDFPNHHRAVTDRKLISKVANTLVYLKALAETTHNKHKYWNEQTRLEKERKLKEKNRPLVTPKVKSAYQCIAEICLPQNKNLGNLLRFLEKLKNYEGDEEYFTTLNYVIEHAENKKIPFIIRLDWRAGVDDLLWWLSAVLKKNYAIPVTLPTENELGGKINVSGDGVFAKIQQKLLECGLQLSFIPTNGDEYIFIVNPVATTKDVAEFINIINQ